MTEATVDQVLHAVAPGGGVDRATFAHLLRARPTTEEVAIHLTDTDVQRIRAAVAYIGATGTTCDAPVLALLLRHQDEGVAQLAESGLWRLWMDGGSERGGRTLRLAIACMRDGALESALELLNALLATEPFFAEVHFQKGLALACLERHAEASVAYRHALRLNPFHFGAAAALGHAAVELDKYETALHFYRRALEIHPRLEDLPAAVHALEARLGPGRGDC